MSTFGNEQALLEKLSAAGRTWIRDKIREQMFTDKIIPLETITTQDPLFRVSTKHDQPEVLIPVEPNSWAMKVNWRGYPTAELIRAPRIATAFEAISSGVYQKSKEEMYVYERLGMPLTKVIEDNIPLDIEKIIDRTFLVHAEACVQAMQDEANGGTTKALKATAVNNGTVVQYSVFKSSAVLAAGADDATIRPMTREDLGTLANILVVKQLQPKRILMSQYDFNQLMAWSLEELGSDGARQSIEKGMVILTTLNNMDYIRTIKTDILRPGNVYVFTDPDFLGKFYALGDIDFYVDRHVNMLIFQARRMVAMAIANVQSVGKMELYGGASNDPNDASYSSNFVPKDEDDLWEPNNKVDSELYEPQFGSI